MGLSPVYDFKLVFFVVGVTLNGILPWVHLRVEIRTRFRSLDLSLPMRALWLIDGWVETNPSNIRIFPMDISI
jgi:hypothetical protein